MKKMTLSYVKRANYFRYVLAACLWLMSLSGASTSLAQSAFDLPVPTLNPARMPWRAIAQPFKPDGRGRLIQSPYDADQLYSFGEDGGLFRSTDQGQTWSWLSDPFTFGYGQTLYFDPVNRQALYARRGATEIVKSLDGGQTWQAANEGLPATPTEMTAEMPLVIHPQATQVLWLGAQQLWRSVNGGASWQAVGTLQHEATVSALAVAPHNARLVLAGTTKGYILRNDKALVKKAHKAEWSEYKLRKGAIAALAFAEDGQTVYAVFVEPAKGKQGHQLYRSVDGGESWQGMDEHSLGRKVYCLALDPQNSQRLFVGTDQGVYGSTDSGAHWFALADGNAGQEPVFNLTIRRDARGSFLYCSRASSGLVAWPLESATKPKFSLFFSEK